MTPNVRIFVILRDLKEARKRREEKGREEKKKVEKRKTKGREETSGKRNMRELKAFTHGSRLKMCKD
jgi:hypothetical protein